MRHAFCSVAGTSPYSDVERRSIYRADVILASLATCAVHRIVKRATDGGHDEPPPRKVEECSMTPIIAGRFEQESQAKAAVAALRRGGFGADDVTVFLATRKRRPRRRNRTNMLRPYVPACWSRSAPSNSPSAWPRSMYCAPRAPTTSSALTERGRPENGSTSIRRSLHFSSICPPRKMFNCENRRAAAAAKISPIQEK